MMAMTEASIQEFLDYLDDWGSSAETVRAYRSDLRGLLSFSERVSDGNFEDVAAAWLTATRDDVKPKTTLRRLSCIRSYARWAGMGVVLHDYRAPKPAPARPHPIPEGVDGVMAMLDVAEQPHEKALVVLTGLCGARISEALAVWPDDVDEQDQVVLFHGKGSKEREVPLSATAWEHLEPALRKAELSGTTLCVVRDRAGRNTISRLAGKAGLSRKVASHDMRATFGTEVNRRTGNIRVVQKLLGHESVETTQVYTDATMQEMRDAVEAVG